MGYPLLIENEEHTFRVYPKQEHRSWSQPKEYSDSESDEESSGSDNDSGSEEEEEEPKEFINKEAPEGLEVADFDGLNINQEMS